MICASVEDLHRVLEEIMLSKTDYAVILRHLAAKVLNCYTQPTSLDEAIILIEKFQVADSVKKTATQFLKHNSKHLPQVHSHGETIALSWGCETIEILIIIGENCYELFKTYNGIVTMHREKMAYSDGVAMDFGLTKMFSAP